MASSIVEKFESMEYGPAPEDAGEVYRWLDAHKRMFGHYIDGAWTPVGSHAKGASFEAFAVKNPSTGDVLATVDSAGAAEVDHAVKAARAALPEWQALTGHQRARYLYALARQVQKHARRLAVLETLDNGKSIRESRDIDIPLVARHFYHHAGWAQLLDEEFPGYAPVGVVGQIIPWNFPLLMFAWKIAPALAAGCTVVIKPAEYTPLTAILFAEIADEIGLPKGVLNVVNGDGRTGAAIVEHPGIDKIAFTGSTEVGRILRKATAKTSKKLSLELGGKSPFVVTTPISIPLWKGWSMGSGSTRGKFAARVRGCWCRSGSPSGCLKRFARACRHYALGLRWIRLLTSAPSSTRCSTTASRRW
jgi:aldehyde dehydrogenase (NAD+)